MLKSKERRRGNECVSEVGENTGRDNVASQQEETLNQQDKGEEAVAVAVAVAAAAAARGETTARQRQARRSPGSKRASEARYVPHGFVFSHREHPWQPRNNTRSAWAHPSTSPMQAACLPTHSQPWHATPSSSPQGSIPRTGESAVPLCCLWCLWCLSATIKSCA